MKTLPKIFLSASIPVKETDKQFIETADVIAIRDAVRALATVVIPRAHLFWGGHPAITPLIHSVMKRMDISLNRHVTLYQSAWFFDDFPKENKDFEQLVITPRENTLEESIDEMRAQMIMGNTFDAGIFIGGMDGVLDEYKLFQEFNGDALCLPVASTGAAARIIFQDMNRENRPPDQKLANNYAYMALFKDLLGNLLQRN